EFTDELLAKRKRDGHLEFQMPEPRVMLDEARAPLDIYPGVRLPAHGWVEECMLLANQAAARHLHKHKLPGLFRVHEQPDIEVVQELGNNQAELTARFEAAPAAAADAGGGRGKTGNAGGAAKDGRAAHDAKRHKGAQGAKDTKGTKGRKHPTDDKGGDKGGA